MRGWTRLAFAVVPVAFLTVFFVYPLVTIILRGLRPEGEWDLAAFGEVLSDPVMREVAWFTLWQAVVSTVLTFVFALPGAYVFARLQFPGKRLLWAALIVPFVLPTVVVASAFLGVLGPRSPFGIDLNGTIWAILLAHVFFNYAVVVRTVGAFWAQLDPDLEAAARALGASRLEVFRTVTWPLLRPSMAAAASIVFLFTFTSFGVVLLLGGVEHRTIEVEIYTQTSQLLNLDTAAVLALVQLVAVSAVLIWYGRVQERRAVRQPLRPAATTAHPPSSTFDRAALGVSAATGAVLLALPLAMLAYRSFSTPDGLGLGFYQELDQTGRGTALFVAPIEAVRNSVVFALAATAIALVVGGLASYVIASRRVSRLLRFVDVAFMLPLGTSAVTVGFGFLITLDEPPLDLRSSLWIIPLAHALVAIPLVIRMVVPVLRSVDLTQREAAAVLGASPWRVWKEIDLRMLARALAVGAGFAFAVSLGEFGATVFLARADWPTLPIAIYRLLGRPGPTNFGQAMALSTVLMVVTVVAMVAIDRLRGDRVSGEF
jgi:thiamine transport system permease protein